MLAVFDVVCSCDHGLEIGNPSTFPFAQPKLLLSNGSGQLTNVTLTNLPTVVEFNHNASVGDVDNDGDLDILVVALSDIRIYLLINDGVGNFTLETDVFPENVRSYDFGPGSVQLADVNNDGRLDAIIGSYGNAIGNAISICLQTQTGQFVENQRVPISAGLGSGGFSQIVSDDFDNDNDIDLIAFNDVGNAGLMALRNDGGNFIDVSVEWLGQFRLFSSYPNTLVSGI